VGVTEMVLQAGLDSGTTLWHAVMHLVATTCRRMQSHRTWCMRSTDDEHDALLRSATAHAEPCAQCVEPP